MEAPGSTVLRTWRADFEDEQIAQEAAAVRADLEQLKREYAQTKARPKAKWDGAKAALGRAEWRVEARREALEQEVHAKIDALQQQLSQTQAEAKQDINKRIAACKADYATRSAKLEQAWAFAKEALAACYRPAPRRKGRGA